MAHGREESLCSQGCPDSLWQDLKVNDLWDRASCGPFLPRNKSPPRIRNCVLEDRLEDGGHMSEADAAWTSLLASLQHSHDGINLNLYMLSGRRSSASELQWLVALLA